MARGTPDWYRSHVTRTTAEIKHAYWYGSGSYTDTDYYDSLAKLAYFEQNLGGKTVRVSSFTTTGYMQYLQDAARIYQTLGNIHSDIRFYKPDETLIGIYSPVEIPIQIEDVDDFRVYVEVPTIRIADTITPLYYMYLFCVSVSYEVL